MKLVQQCSLIAAAFFVSASLCADAPARAGVGFELTLDYGVASIYFSNGSYVDVARIEGSPSYKHGMRLASAPSSDQSDPAFSHNGLQSHIGTSSLRDYLPPWLGGNDHRSHYLASMLRALTAAAESYLDKDVAIVEAVFPFHTSQAQREALHQTALALKLDIPMWSQPPSGLLAARAHDLISPCPDPDDSGSYCSPGRLILTLEYTGAALSGALVLDEFELLESRREMHEPLLGADALAERCEKNHEDECVNDLARALRKFIKLPLDDRGNGSGIKHIGELVLHGEVADDKLLETALKKVLKEHGRSDALAAATRSSATLPPLYAASRGVAQDCWSRMQSSSHGELR